MNESIVEHAKHLRSVQFSLLIVCVVLLLISSLLRSSYIHEAYKDLSNIKKIVEEYYQNDSPWILNYEKSLLRHSINSYLKNQTSALAINSFPEGIRINSMGNQVWGVNLLYGDDNWVINVDVEDSEISNAIKEEQTLKRFIEYWNFLYQARYIYLPKIGSKAAIYNPKSDRYEIHEIETLDRVETDDYTYSLSLVDVHDEKWIERCLPKRVFGKWYEDINKLEEDNLDYVLCPSPITLVEESYPKSEFPLIMIIAASAEKIEFNSLERIIEISGMTDWKVRPFSLSFRELFEVASSYSDIPLSKINTILEGERNRTGEGVRIFGVHVASSVAREWGAGVIISIQLYFLIHLVSFPISSTTKNDFPWAGLYNNQLSKVVFFITAILLPPITILILMYSTWFLGKDNQIFWIISPIINLISFLLSFYIYKTWSKIQQV